ncbi:MAG: hypothetical protein JRG71_11000 [Deltaproteobacteria bacterium]|nr:hypothetical protein [Deltaproteobacteria bacterium]
MRLTIETPSDRHPKIETTTLQRLEKFLKPRIKAANNGQLSSKSIDDIFNEVLDEKI